MPAKKLETYNIHARNIIFKDHVNNWNLHNEQVTGVIDQIC